MKSSSFFLSLLLLIALSACQPKASVMKTSVINSEIKTYKVPQVLLTHIESALLDTLSSNAVVPQKLSYQFKEPIILNLQEGYLNSYIYVSPGDSINLQQGGNGEVSLFQSEPRSAENQYLIDFDKINTSISRTYAMNRIAGQEADGFLSKLDEKYHKLDSLYTQISQNESVHDYFKQAIALRIKSMKLADKMNYQPFYKYIKKEEAVLPEGFLSELDDKFYDDPGLLLFAETRRLGTSINGKDLDFEEMGSVSKFYDAIYQKADEVFSHPSLRHFFKLEALTQQINYGSGLDGADEMVAQYKSEVSNPYMLQRLATTIRPWENIRKGMAAPDFSGVTREGKMVRLSELKGKAVYVDVWATWCGPCIREIPSLKKLEKDMHERNVEFVSISIDEQKNKQKWLDFVKKENLGGTQILAENAWQSQVTRGYNITGIPRFLLIDTEGKIISANAPRPSSSETKALIESNT